MSYRIPKKYKKYIFVEIPKIVSPRVSKFRTKEKLWIQNEKNDSQRKGFLTNGESTI